MPRLLCQTVVCSMVVLALFAAPPSVYAQASAATSPKMEPPFIAASAVGESRVSPDRALVQVSVESRNESAASAAADNRTIQERVIATVKALGIAPAQIRTVGYGVTPEYAQNERGKAPRITGYRANNTVQVEVRSIDLVGKVIDASLGAGATNIASVGLYSSNTDTARREAVQNAVTKARGEGEAAATAGGGSLGALIELTIEPGAVPRPMMQQVMVTGASALMRENMSMSTPVEGGETLVLAVVRVRWQFVPGTR